MLREPDDTITLLSLTICMALCSGNLYLFSLFHEPLLSRFHGEITIPDIEKVYSFGVIGQQVNIVAGIIYDRIGPCACAWYAICFGFAGNILMFSVCNFNFQLWRELGVSLTSLLAFAYFLTCQGAGSLYCCALYSVTQRISESKRGLCIGIVSAAFGLSAGFWGLIFRYVLQMSLAAFFGVSAMVFSLVGLVYIVMPSQERRMSQQPSLRDLTQVMLFRNEYYLSFLVFPVMQTLGSGMFIANAALLAKVSIADLDQRENVIALSVQLISVCGCLGRILCGFFIDFGKRRGVHVTSFFILTAFSFFLLVSFIRISPALFCRKFLPILCGIAGTLYGSNWSIMPAYVASVFGSRFIGIGFAIESCLTVPGIYMFSYYMGLVYQSHSAKMPASPEELLQSEGGREETCFGDSCIADSLTVACLSALTALVFSLLLRGQSRQTHRTSAETSLRGEIERCE